MSPTNTKHLVRQIRALLPEPVTAAGTGAERRPDLGDPLDIKAAARLIGCSAWTLRQSLIPQGLPCFRTGPSGKLIFYRDQVIRWVERRQRAEGGHP